MIYNFMFSALFIIIIIFSVVSKKWNSPIVLFCIPLLIQYFVYQFFYLSSYPIHNKTRFFVLSCISMFFLGYLLLMSICKRVRLGNYYSAQKPLTNRNYKKLKRISTVFLIIGVMGFIIGLIQAIRIGGSNPSLFFNNIRRATVSENSTINPSNYMLLFLDIEVLLAISTLSIFREKRLLSKNMLVSCILMLIVSAFFSMGRTTLLLRIISIVIAYSFVNTSKGSNKKKGISIFVLGALGLALFVGLSYFIAKQTNKLGENNDFFLISYIGYPLVTFDKFVIFSNIRTYGGQMFQPFFKILSIFNPSLNQYMISGNDLLINQVINPETFNVFTVFKDIYFDFSFFGGIFFCSILGGISAVIYSRAERGSIFFRIFYSIYAYCLLISFFANQFNLTSNIYYIIIICFLSIYIDEKQSNDLENIHPVNE